MMAEVVGDRISLINKHSWVAEHGKQNKVTRDISSFLASMKYNQSYLSKSLSTGTKDSRHNEESQVCQTDMIVWPSWSFMHLLLS